LSCFVATQQFLAIELNKGKFATFFIVFPARKNNENTKSETAVFSLSNFQLNWDQGIGL